jgi:hypothetical protein
MCSKWKTKNLALKKKNTEYYRIKKSYESGEISRNQLPRALNGFDSFEFNLDMGLYSDFLKKPKDIIYVENDYYESLNNFFIRNTNFDFSKTYNIIYLPCLTKKIEEYGLLYYKHPDLPNDFQIEESLLSSYPLNFFCYPEDASKIKHGMMVFEGVYSNHGAKYISGNYYPLEEGDDDYIFEQLRSIIAEICDRHDKDVPRYMKVPKPDVKEGTSDTYAEELFPWVVNNNEVAIIINEVRERVAKLRNMGIAEKFLESIIKVEPKLSKLVVTKDKRIVLPDYNNLEMKMEPINKAVYLLFLSHPEGILFKQLPDYREELAKIYESIKPLGMNERAIKSIEDVTNPCLNSINEKCARIRGAFISQFDENIARHYYIYGERGEAKKIALPRDLVTWK